MFYYEGQHLTSRLVGFKAYDDDCAVHDRWEPVRKLPLTVEMTVEDTLRVMQTCLQARQVNVSLTDDCFVDYVVRRDNDHRYEVMLPGRQVAAYIEQDVELRGIPFSGMYQHEWRDVDAAFPYPWLTLASLGVPRQAVLNVTTEQGAYYVEIE